MSVLLKVLEKIAEEIIKSKPELFENKINRIEIGEIKKGLKKLEIIKIDEIKNLEETEMEIVMLKGKIKMERIKSSLEKF